MLFNSPIFIFLFLPVTLMGYYFLGRLNYYQTAKVWLVLASLFFYAWWNTSYVVLILFSIFFNFALGTALSKQDKYKKRTLFFGIAVNFLLLGYFKYVDFAISNVNQIFGTDISFKNVLLPLAISFFTFQQITFLVDAYRGLTKEYNFLNYCLFVIFFPQLIAGPIVHHWEVIPQFAKKVIYKFKQENLAVGLTIFFIGLFKKVVIADRVAGYASPVFQAAAYGDPINFLNVWCAAFAYTFQLYFDFSGYSDMAIGLGRMFGIRLPLNFYSPYKAVNIIDFWRRWHITLSRFLREYLYIPLGGNRHGEVGRYVNIMITMILGGLWHGANWTFVIWGWLHGLYLVGNHLWHVIKRWYGFGPPAKNGIMKYASCFMTFILVVVSWVFFRAADMNAALSMIKAMSGAYGIVLPESYFAHLNRLGGLGQELQLWGVRFEEVGYFHGVKELIHLSGLLMVVWFLPNTQEIMVRYQPAINTYKQNIGQSKLQWRATLLWAAFTSLITVISILTLTKVSEFLYFQF